MNHGGWLVLALATANSGSCDDLVTPNPAFGASDDGETDGGDAQPDAGTFEGLGDTYVDKDTPQAAHGAEPVLLVDARRTSFVRLPDLSSTDGALERLTLTLYCTQAGGEIELAAVVNQWDEATLTSTDAGSLGSMALTSFEPVVGENVIELADLLLPFQFEQASPSIRLDPASTNNEDDNVLECDSREGAAGPRFTMVGG